MYFSSQWITARPTTKATAVARKIGPQAGSTGSEEMSNSLKKPEPTTAGMASRKAYLAAASRL